MSPNTRLFAIRISVFALVLAPDETEARVTAREELREILGDANKDNFDMEVVGANVELSQLRDYGWDAQCIPYGGDKETRLSVLLTEGAA